MGPKTQSLIETLEELTSLLHRHGEAHWAAWLESDLRSIRAGDLSGISHLLSAYGGMGSLNDLVLDPVNGHSVESAVVDQVNESLSHLRSQAWSLADQISREAVSSTAEETGSPYLKNDPIKVLLFGATGMVGQGVLRECLLDPAVRQVLVVGRRATGQRHEKLRELVLPEVADLAAVEPDLAGFDACLFCLGVSAAGMTEARYTSLTYDLTLAVAQTLARLNPDMTFVYVSGMGTDSSERGRTMWARVKGKTENALLQLPFKATYMFRPAAIVPLHGIQSSTRWTRILYAVTKPLFPVFRALFPNYVTTTEQLGRAMIAVARNGFQKKVLEPPDIRRVPLGPRLVKRIIEFDTVRVIAMMGSPESHLSTSGAVRAPAVGDLGMVVDLTPTSDPDNPETRFLVEKTDGEAGCIWLAEFSREELEIVAETAGPTTSKSDGGIT